MVLYDFRSENAESYFSSNALNIFQMFQKANIKIFVWRWAYVYSPFERCYFFSQATMMHLAGHFWELLQFGCHVCRGSDCDKPESRARRLVCPLFLFLSNEHSGTLSELYCISFWVFVFCCSHRVMKELNLCACKKCGTTKINHLPDGLLCWM